MGIKDRLAKFVASRTTQNVAAGGTLAGAAVEITLELLHTYLPTLPWSTLDAPLTVLLGAAITAIAARVIAFKRNPEKKSGE